MLYGQGCVAAVCSHLKGGTGRQRVPLACEFVPLRGSLGGCAPPWPQRRLTAVTPSPRSPRRRSPARRRRPPLQPPGSPAGGGGGGDGRRGEKRQARRQQVGAGAGRAAPDGNAPQAGAGQLAGLLLQAAGWRATLHPPSDMRRSSQAAMNRCVSGPARPLLQAPHNRAISHFQTRCTYSTGETDAPAGPPTRSSRYCRMAAACASADCCRPSGPTASSTISGLSGSSSAGSSAGGAVARPSVRLARPPRPPCCACAPPARRPAARRGRPRP